MMTTAQEPGPAEKGLEGIVLEAESPGRIRVAYSFPCRLTRGDYTITLATQDLDGGRQDWRDDFLEFRVNDRREFAGTAWLDGNFEWTFL